MKGETCGASSGKMAYSGSGTFNGQPFTFSGPIAEFNMSYALGKKHNYDHNYEANVWTENPFRLIINEGDLQTDASLSAEQRSELVAQLTSSLTSLKQDIQDAKKKYLPNFPMDLAVPFVSMFYATQFSEKVDLSDKYLAMDFSVEHLNMLKKS